MKFDFIPTKTDDGSYGLFNNKVNDVYHCSTGAYSEALEKFVLQSDLLDKAKSSRELKILDICYGLGYNSKSAVDEILKINPNCKIKIDLVEIDINVLALSLLLKIEKIREEILTEFFTEFCKNSEILDTANSICKMNDYKDLFAHEFVDYIQNKQMPTLNYTNASCNDLSLHNIYYRTNSKRNIQSLKHQQKQCFLELTPFICDLRKALPKLSGQYDAIFHDGFTPLKQPTVWSKEIFDKLYELLKDDGRLVTYSCSSQVRGAMIESGFSIIGKYSLENKSIGTIAFKNNSKQDIILNEFENGLLATTAGIPFYDPTLNFTVDEILTYRQSIIKKSNRTGSSKYRKELGYK